MAKSKVSKSAPKSTVKKSSSPAASHAGPGRKPNLAEAVAIISDEITAAASPAGAGLAGNGQLAISGAVPSPNANGNRNGTINGHATGTLVEKIKELIEVAHVIAQRMLADVALITQMLEELSQQIVDHKTEKTGALLAMTYGVNTD